MSTRKDRKKARFNKKEAKAVQISKAGYVSDKIKKMTTIADKGDGKTASIMLHSLLRRAGNQ